MIIKNFKKSSKFLKLNNNLNQSFLLMSRNNFRLNEKQKVSVKNKLIRNFKSNKPIFLFNENKTLTSKSLNSKLGSGKGKIKEKISTLRKYQFLLNCSNAANVYTINKTILKFINLTNYKFNRFD